MEDPDKYKCPYTGFKKKCMDLRNFCPKWVHILGTDPNRPDKPIDHYDCADRWQPILTIEVAKESRVAAAAINALRKEVVTGRETSLQIAVQDKIKALSLSYSNSSKEPEQ